MQGSDEARLEALEARVAMLEGLLSAPPPQRRQPLPLPPLLQPEPPVAEPEPAPEREPEPEREPFDLEELLGGRVLGWVGGIAVVLAAVFFLVMAVHNGWIGEPARVLLAFLGSTTLFVVGLWLYESKGRTQAALAVVAAAIAALYATDATATAVYGLISAPAGLLLAGLIGAAAAAIAVRWDSQVVAGIGLVGALLAPILVDAGTSNASLAFMTIALVATVAVLLWRRWGWLASIAFVVTAPQAAAWIWDERNAHLGLSLAVVAAFWAMYVVAALGYELRAPTEGLRVSSALLVFANGALATAGGWALLHDVGHGDAATVWVVGAALVYLVLGTAALWVRVSHEIAALLIAVGAGLAAIGTALALDGPALVAGWSAEAVLLAWVARRTGDLRAYIGAAVFLALAAGHVLVQEAPPKALAYGVESLPTAVAAVAIVLVAGAAVAFLLGRSGLAKESAGLWEATAVWAVYLGSIVVVDVAGAQPGSIVQHAQLSLSAFWAALGFGAFVAGLVRDVRPLRLGGLALLGLAVAKVFVVDLAALQSIWRVASFLALGLLLLGAAFAYQRMRKAAS